MAEETTLTATQSGVKILRVINFSYPLPEQVIKKLGHPKIESIQVSLDFGAPVAPQVVEIVDDVNTSLDGTVSGLGIVLPEMSEVTAYLLAEFHGRMDGFPTIISLRRDNKTGVFVLANEGPQSLNHVRCTSRGRRTLLTATGKKSWSSSP